MISTEVLHTTVGIIGNVISFALFLSPIKTFYTIYKKKTVDEFIPDPYIAAVMNCLLWIFYGLPVVHPDSLLVVTINGIGLGLETIYLIMFMIYGRNKDRKKIVICVAIELVFLAAVVVATLLGFHTHDMRSTVVGVLCVIFGVIMYASPLTIMKKVVMTKSVEYMPFLLTLTSFLNGLCWLSYALIKFDLYILIANGLGAMLGLVQLILYGIYYFGATPVKEEVKKTHVELAEV